MFLTFPVEGSFPKEERGKGKLKVFSLKFLRVSKVNTLQALWLAPIFAFKRKLGSKSPKSEWMVLIFELRASEYAHSFDNPFSTQRLKQSNASA